MWLFRTFLLLNSIFLVLSVPNASQCEPGFISNGSICELQPQIVEYRERLNNAKRVVSEASEKQLMQSLQKNIAVTCGGTNERLLFVPFGIVNYPPFPVRDISEAVPWLFFIVENYKWLPDHVHFLHGHETSWHTSRYMQQYLVNTKPIVSYVYSQMPTIWGTQNSSELNPREYVGIEYLVNLTFTNKTVQDVFTDLEMRWWGCCAELVVSREAIQSRPYKYYYELLEHMLYNLHVPWGYVMERSWSLLFFGLDGRAPNHIGCFIDKPEDPVLPVKKGEISSKTPCYILCKGFKYSGLKSNGECFCGNESMLRKHEFGRDCYPCRKSGPNSGLMCGNGEDVIAVYKLLKYEPEFLKYLYES